MNIEHPMVTQMNEFGYPKRYWSYEMKRSGDRKEVEDGQEECEDDETSANV
ncbi:hypothetical protein [Bacillus sp. 179-C3.3 HS]|uniref:hypothetical protein n=1 Tax=Bacillus sp. 179-C3.3 HS TaxID=3232162 RepID=UPI0039A25039